MTIYDELVARGLIAQVTDLLRLLAAVPLISETLRVEQICVQ